MSPNHWNQLKTKFSLHFHYKTIGANCKLHLHHIFTTFSPHLHVTKPLEPIKKLNFHYIFTTKLLEPIVNYIYTTFSQHFHHIYMSPNHWSQLQTRFSLHFHYKTIGANCKLHLHHIFTTFSPHLHVTKPLEPITN